MTSSVLAVLPALECVTACLGSFSSMPMHTFIPPDLIFAQTWLCNRCMSAISDMECIDRFSDLVFQCSHDLATHCLSTSDPATVVSYGAMNYPCHMALQPPRFGTHYSQNGQMSSAQTVCKRLAWARIEDDTFPISLLRALGERCASQTDGSGDSVSKTGSYPHTAPCDRVWCLNSFYHKKNALLASSRVGNLQTLGLRRDETILTKQIIRCIS